MGQARYFARGTRSDAEGAYAALDAAFGDEGLPVSIFEWDEAAGIFEVAVYFDLPDAPAEDAVVTAFAPLVPEREDLPDVDWMQSVLAELKPVRAGRFLVHGAHDRDKVKSNDLGIKIEAGQAFGTGHHGTTAGCLQLIGEVLRRRKPRNALDLGTGSAVLAIAIARLGRIPVLATDIDPIAVRVARDNMRANGVANRVTGAVATGFDGAAFADGARYDLIVANILAGPLMRLAPHMQRRLAKGGNIILSGILARQRRSVLAAYRDQGLYHRRTLQMGDWVSLHLTR